MHALLGLPFDMAIRLYLESFRLPGEAQKINRVMESFGKHYHAQCPNLFKNADAVYILGYSVILLNTDQHNVGVRRPAPFWHQLSTPVQFLGIYTSIWGSTTLS